MNYYTTKVALMFRISNKYFNYFPYICANMQKKRYRYMEKLNRVLATLICIIVFVGIIGLFSGCSAKYRFDRLLKKHPEFATTDTVREKIEVPVYVYVDSSKLKKANKKFDSNMDSAKTNTAELQKKEPCAELANKVQKNLMGARTAKARIDTVYKQAECRVEPYFKSDSNVIISAKVVNGNIVVDYTFKQAKYYCEQRKFWQFWEFWICPAFLVFLVIMIVRRRS